MQGHKMCLCVIQSLTNSSLGNIVQVKEHWEMHFALFLLSGTGKRQNIEELSDREAFLIKIKLFGVHHTHESDRF